MMTMMNQMTNIIISGTKANMVKAMTSLEMILIFPEIKETKTKKCALFSKEEYADMAYLAQVEEPALLYIEKCVELINYMVLLNVRDVLRKKTVNTGIHHYVTNPSTRENAWMINADSGI